MANAVILILIAFALHFVWEIAQYSIFYVHGDLSPMITAIIVAAFTTGAVMSRDASWIHQPWTVLLSITMEVTALALIIGNEKVGLHMNRWSYRATAPILPIAGVLLILSFNFWSYFP